MINFKNKHVFAVYAALSTFLLACQPQVAALVDTSSDLIEFESIWQYLKAYSIFQDNIPPDPFVFSSPEDILLSIPDTLKGNDLDHRYTKYYEYGFPARLTSVSAQAVLPAAVYPTVWLDTVIKGSMIMITISKFSETTGRDFLRLMPKVSPYANIIIDVRENLGGLIDQLDTILDTMVPLGTGYIQARYREFNDTIKQYQTFGWKILKTKIGQSPAFQNKRFAILIDSMSASASEMLTAGLYEAYQIPIFGTTSYGKGIAQIKFTRRERQSIEMTFMQMKGVSGRIGEYHRAGIACDSVSAAIRRSADSIYLYTNKPLLNRPVFYAIKRLDSTVTLSSRRIIWPAYPLYSPLLKEAVCERVMREEDVKW